MKHIHYIALATVALTATTLRAETIAYTGATIETLAKAGTIEGGTVIVTDGKITDVGADVEIPDTAKTIDVSGQTIMPGIVEIYHPISVGGGSAASAVRTITIGGRTFTIGNRTSTTSTVFMRIADNLDPLVLKTDLKRLSRIGIGFANLVTRGYGQAVHAKMDPTDPESAVIDKDGYMYLALTNSTSSLNVLRTGLGIKSTGSSSTPTRTTATVSRTRSGAPTTSTTTRPTTTSSRTSTDPSKALWADIKAGKKPLMVNVNNPATILHVVEILKKSDKVKVVLISTGASVYQAFDVLKAQKNFSIVLRPGIDTVPFSQNRVNVARMLHDAKMKFGFTVSTSTDVTGAPDTPLFPLAMLVKTGLPRDIALKAVSQMPATMLGLEKTLGSIEKGKSANMIFVNGDPLDASTQIQRVLVEGKTTHEG